MTSPRCTCLQCASTDGAFFSFLSSTPRSPATLASPRSLPWWAQDQIPELKLVDASTSHQNSPQVQHAAVGGRTALHWQLQTTTILRQSLLFVAIFMIEIFIVAISSDRDGLFILLTLWDRNGSNCVQNSRNPDAPPPSPSNISSLKWWRCYQKLVKKMAVMMMIISFGHTGFELSKYPFQQLIGISWGRSASVIV